MVESITPLLQSLIGMKITNEKKTLSSMIVLIKITVLLRYDN